MAPRDPEIDDAIATLARGLQGAVESLALGGIEALPRPHFPAPAAVQPQAVSAMTPRAARAREPEPASIARAAPATSLPIAADGNVADAIAALVASTSSAEEKLTRLEREVVGACSRCKLHRGRNKLVFGTGSARTDLVFVGEGPGADEDRQGVPFVGRAGELLTRMIEAMGRTRADVYICNVVKCRPPNNRDPEPDEVAACEGFLKAQLAIIRPRVVVCLGRHAAQTLLKIKTPITRLRGTWQLYQGIDLMPTYHPSYLLREEADPDKRRKREAWADLKMVMARVKPSA